MYNDCLQHICNIVLIITINDDTLSKSRSSFSRYTKDEFLRSYTIVCTTPGCYSCEG